jgi:hypothetical protein
MLDGPAWGIFGSFLAVLNSIFLTEFVIILSVPEVYTKIHRRTR